MKITVLDPELLRYFDRFGRSLHGDERIEFDFQGNKVVLNVQVRKKLIEASHASSWTDELTLKGHVSALDKNNKVFDFERKNGSRIKAPFIEQYQEIIKEAFDNYENKALLEVKGVATIC